MSVWSPDPDEHLLVRSPIMFATGAAPSVSGMRWFRDSQRRDIQHELPGWPEGPTYTKRSAADSGARGALAAVGRVLGVIVFTVLTGGGGTGDFSVLGSPEDPANEVEDFPVLWGDPGSIAWTLPWQLDPIRHGMNRRTHLIVTDRRILITGLEYAEVFDDEVLWETERSNIARVQPMDYSKVNFKDFTSAESDLRIDFTDGSWCRLASNRRYKLIEQLTLTAEIVPPERLTPGQCQRVEKFVAGKTVVGSPVVRLLTSGRYITQIRESENVSAFSGITFQSDVMGPNGEEPQY